MSRINDALKQARQAQPRTPTTHFPPGHTADDDRSSPLIWIVPSVIIFLIVAGIFFMAWASAHRTVHSIVGNIELATNPPVTIQDSPPVPVPAPEPAPVVAEPVELPVVQGIFYSTKSPTAIVNDKNVSPGDRIKGYRVKAITKDAVILTGPDDQDVKLKMQQ
jgi:hypothetical protein